MSAFDIRRSLERAERRLTPGPRRADAGRSRLDPRVEALLLECLMSRERSALATVVARLLEACRERGLRAPSRAAAYQAIHRAVRQAALPEIPLETLPEAVCATLHNVTLEGFIPGDQVVFQAFNCGTGAALSFAAGMPWIYLRRAELRRGWRPKSLALLRAVIRFRGC